MRLNPTRVNRRIHIGASRRTQGNRYIQMEPTGKRSRLLVVEGHPDTLEALELFLRLSGRAVEFAPDVGAALVKARRREFDVLLCEINLPGRDGGQLLRELALQGRRPPRAISMGAGGASQESARSQAAGFDLHLAKPFRAAELAAALG